MTQAILYFAAFDEAPEELDVTLFEISARSYPAIEKAASEFVAKVISFLLLASMIS